MVSWRLKCSDVVVDGFDTRSLWIKSSFVLATVKHGNYSYAPLAYRDLVAANVAPGKKNRVVKFVEVRKPQQVLNLTCGSVLVPPC